MKITCTHNSQCSSLQIAGEGVYGDGRAEPGWGYLDVKPDEDLYGGLADVFIEE